MLTPWQCTRLEAPGRPPLEITATPCRHGPPLSRPLTGDHPRWRDLPSWFLIGEEDHIISALQHYMAKRAGAHETLEISGASHAITVSHPKAVARQIFEASGVAAAA